VPLYNEIEKDKSKNIIDIVKKYDWGKVKNGA
jgi:hypothetical protein